MALICFVNNMALCCFVNNMALFLSIIWRFVVLSIIWRFVVLSIIWRFVVLSIIWRFVFCFVDNMELLFFSLLFLNYRSYSALVCVLFCRYYFAFVYFILFCR